MLDTHESTYIYIVILLISFEYIRVAWYPLSYAYHNMAISMMIPTMREKSCIYLHSVRKFEKSSELHTVIELRSHLRYDFF